MLILFSLYSVTAMAKRGFFMTYQNNSGKGTSKYTLQVDIVNGPRRDAFQMRQLILCHHKKRFRKKKKKNKKPQHVVDAKPTADGNKRRLKLVAFCIAKPKLHRRSTLTIIVFK